MSKKQYKAIIFDVDGTLVPNNGTHIPSEKVITAVKKAMEKVHVSIANSRPIFAITAFIGREVAILTCIFSIAFLTAVITFSEGICVPLLGTSVDLGGRRII